MPQKPAEWFKWIMAMILLPALSAIVTVQWQLQTAQAEVVKDSAVTASQVHMLVGSIDKLDTRIGVLSVTIQTLVTQQALCAERLTKLEKD